MKTIAQRIFQVLLNAAKGWMRHNAIRLAAALAFYTSIALAPLLMMILYISGIFWGDEAAKGFLVDKIASLTDRGAANFIQSLVAGADRADAGPLAGAVSFAILIWGSTRLFAQLQEALNVIWEVEEKAAQIRVKITRFAKQRLLAFGMTLVVAFILLVSLVFDAMVSYGSNRFDLPGQDWLWGTVNYAISLAIVWLLFAMIYKVLPFKYVRYKDAFIGALLAATLFSGGKHLFSLYLSKQESVYGASGSLLGILLWVYFSAQAMFFGAEVARAWSESRTNEAVDRPADTPS